MRISPFSIFVVFAALMLIGLAFIPRLGIQLHPVAEMPAMRISFWWPEAPAIQVEREVTSKIESALSTMRSIKEISSVSQFGNGFVDILLKPGVDPDLVRFEVSSHIRRLYAGLPDGVSYPSISARRAAGRANPLLTYTITAPDPTRHIAHHVERNVIPRLVQIRGIDNISLHGANPFVYQIIFQPEKLQVLGLSTREIAASINDYLEVHYLGLVHASVDPASGAARLPVMLHTGSDKEPQWDRIPVGTSAGRIIHLTDVAAVRLMEDLPQSYFRINGQTTLLMVITASEGENQISLSNTIKSKVNQLERELPDGWQIHLTYDDTQFIRTDLTRAGLRMVFSFTILMLFVLLIARSTRYLFMILATVVANILLAVSWYYLLGIEIHLYSLAGITVSFGIIIDNSIVMIEHLRNHKNKKVFLAILAATLTTMGSLSVIFLLEQQQQLQLKDFAGVVLVNLALSLLVAWFFIPALFTKMGMNSRSGPAFTPTTRFKVKLSKAYLRLILQVRRVRWLTLMVLILGFGIPLHLLPTSVEGESLQAAIYNKTIGSPFYQQHIKRVAETVLGGSFRLFSRFVFEGSFFVDPERTTIFVRGQMPDGSTVHQLNDAMIQMERYLKAFPQIEQFQTTVRSHSDGSIIIHFRPEYELGAFPHVLQNNVIQKALSIGGAEWGVFGVGQGFSNVLSRGGGGGNIMVEGYNYDRLYRYAQMIIQMAKENPRVREPRISGAGHWGSINRIEFFTEFNSELLALHNLNRGDVFASLSQRIMKYPVATVYHDNQPVGITIVPAEHLQYTVWDLAHMPLHIHNRYFKPEAFVNLERRAMGNNIYKFNQQYRLLVDYTFVGSHELQQRLSRQLRDQINHIMPKGFRASLREWIWDTEEQSQYLLILLVIVIIFFICAILLESLFQPLVIISLIPSSFIGLFLTFYLFDLNFDQGGWAAFILLSGLAVNSGLYILNDFNSFRRRYTGRSPAVLYLKAFQYKILPVVLTIFSTIIGLIPFLVGEKEAFWFAFAAGTIGGLVFSLIAILWFFPVFLSFKQKQGES